MLEELNQMAHFNFPFPTEGKRYHTWSRHLKDEFGFKVFKVALDAGFDCPNRDGTVAYGGCTFCSVAGSGDFAGDRVEPIESSFRKSVTRCIGNGKKVSTSPISKLTRTHMHHFRLKEKFEAALAQPGVVGLSIGTRPDCLPDDVVDYLAELNERTYLWVELGLQTVHEKTAKLVNRAHDLPLTLRAWKNCGSMASVYVPILSTACRSKTPI